MSMRGRKKNPLQQMSIQTKLLMTFALIAVLIFVINLMLYSQINHSMCRLDEEMCIRDRCTLHGCF